MKLSKKIWWAYLVEVVLSALVVWLAVIVFGLEAVTGFAGRIGLNVVGLIGVAVFGAAFAAMLVVMQKIDSPFYQWLDSKGALTVYLTGFKYVLFVCVLSFALVLFLSQYSTSKILALGTLYVLVLLGINTVTFLNNITSLMRLQSAYRKRVDSVSKR